MSPRAPRRAAIYARISITSEESVSIERQVEAATQYAAARGWTVVGTFIDDGVSATKHKPEDRAGWRALLDSPEQYDAVIVWKVDRLSRRVLDFLHADEALRERKAGLTAVEDPIDMTTAQGRAFATMLAVFGEMEAAAISARVKDARRKLVRSGRVPGGTIPYGWRSVPSPDGPGYVLAQDPERIDYVRGAVDRIREGATIYAVKQWLDDVGAPLPGASQKARKGDGWSYTTVERLLRNPVLAGMTAFNPGNDTKLRGDDVLRDERGLPVVDESVAIMPVSDWRAMIRQLDSRTGNRSLPRAMKSSTSALLSGLVYCADCEARMHRGTTNGRPGYSCPKCHQTITNFEGVVVDAFLQAKGDRVRWSMLEEVHEGGAALLPEIAQRLDELDSLIRDSRDRTERARLQSEQAALLDLRDEKEAEAPAVTVRPVRGTQMFGEDWAEAETVEEQRAVLDDALARVWVRRGGTGRPTPAKVLARLRFDWKQPEDTAPTPDPDDATLAEWAASDPAAPQRRARRARKR